MLSFFYLILVSYFVKYFHCFNVVDFEHDASQFVVAVLIKTHPSVN